MIISNYDRGEGLLEGEWIDLAEQRGYTMQVLTPLDLRMYKKPIKRSALLGTLSWEMIFSKIKVEKY